jgi:hypothetical protein
MLYFRQQGRTCAPHVFCIPKNASTMARSAMPTARSAGTGSTTARSCWRSSRWVAWTQEGFSGASPGAYGVLRWRVNRGWDEAALRNAGRPEIHPDVLVQPHLVRFGILSKTPSADLRAGVLQIVTPDAGERCQLRLRGPSGTEPIALDARLIKPGIPDPPRSCREVGGN